MIISDRDTSNYLTQASIKAPFIATMDDVTRIPSLRNPDVLHFIEQEVRPLPLNMTNRRAIVEAYGRDTDQWHGKPIEIYVDPTVPNPVNPDRPGGIRVRVPAPPTPAENFALAIAAMERVTTIAKADEWKVWWVGLSDTTAQMDDDFMDAYDAALQRIANLTKGS